MRFAPLLRAGAEAVLPERAYQYVADEVERARFNAWARTFRDEHGLEPVKRRLTVMSYPTPISTRSTSVLARLCAILGYRLVSAPSRRFDVLVKFHNATFSGDAASPFGDIPAINGACNDISKMRVDREFHTAFGASTLVDPQQHHGSLVEKPDENAESGRRMVQAPLDPKPGFVYQRLIDSTTDDGTYIEYRLPIHDGRFPLVYRKVIDEGTRFEKKATSVTLEDPADHFSASELDGIRTVCRRMGVDFGEMDVLRDKRDGLPYVLDVNDTPEGLLRWVSPPDRARAFAMLAASFQEMCESWADR